MTVKSIDCLRSKKLGFFAEIPTPLLAYIPALGTQQFLTNRPNRASIMPEFRGFVLVFLLGKT